MFVNDTQVNSSTLKQSSLKVILAHYHSRSISPDYLYLEKTETSLPPHNKKGIIDDFMLSFNS